MLFVCNVFFAILFLAIYFLQYYFVQCYFLQYHFLQYYFLQYVIESYSQIIDKAHTKDLVIFSKRKVIIDGVKCKLQSPTDDVKCESDHMHQPSQILVSHHHFEIQPNKTVSSPKHMRERCTCLKNCGLHS